MKGLFTILKGELLKIVEIEGKMNLVYYGENPPEGFKKMSENVFTSIVNRDQIKFAFKRDFKAEYEGELFDIRSINSDFVTLVTDDADLSTKFRFETIDPRVYQKNVALPEISVFWETRKQAQGWETPMELPLNIKISANEIR